MNNIGDVKNCYGCGVCATVCSRNIINLALDSEGFYKPYIADVDLCTGCGLCREVCAYLHDDLALSKKDIHAYASWSKDQKVRRKCSSGGVGFEIGRFLLGQGYKVCGVRYNVDKNIAEHYIASDIEELIPSIGSKYIQSYTLNAFKAINRKNKYLMTGTPCQIDSFRRYIKKFRCEDHFVLLDFFCHGVPSMFIWQKYSKWVEKQIGKITYVSWRNKRTGWHDSWSMGLDGEKKYVDKIEGDESYDELLRDKRCFFESRFSKRDMFYSLFLGNLCLGKQCYKHCKYKYDKSSADIRIGDMWGDTFREDEDGVSCAVAFTDLGRTVLANADCDLISYPFDIVAEGQLKKNLRFPQYVRNLLIHGAKIKWMPILLLTLMSRIVNRFKLYF